MKTLGEGVALKGPVTGSSTISAEVMTGVLGGNQISKRDLTEVGALFHANTKAEKKMTSTQEAALCQLSLRKVKCHTKGQFVYIWSAPMRLS